MDRVFADGDLSPGEKLVMLAIADNANDEGVCYPSISTLQSKTSFSRPTVISNIKKLESRGYLIGVNRARKKGGRSSNIYLVFPAENYPNLDEFFKDKFAGLPLLNGSQSKEGLLGVQSKAGLLGKGGQSKEGLLESEPSLSKKLFNHKLFSCLSKPEKDLFLEYLSLRKKQRLVTTFAIQDRLLKKYHEFGANPQIIEHAITANWKDFYPLKEQGNEAGRGTRKTSTAEMHHDTLKRIAARGDAGAMGEPVV